MTSSLRFASFNCKSVKRSIDGVRELCATCDVIALQECWLLPEELPFLSTIHDDFSSTGTSAVDTSAGMLRGRPYGGVALLWRKSAFTDVSVVPSDNPRVCAIRISSSERPFIVMSVYMPTDAVSNLPEFSHCLGLLSAIVDSSDVEAVYCLGDFNAHPHGLFFTELLNCCSDNNFSCVDVDRLGLTSNTYTYVSDCNGARRWLDHCLCTESSLKSVCNVSVKYDVMWSDHYPLLIECDLNVIRPKIKQSISCDNFVVWGEKSSEAIYTYRQECHRRLRNIDFPRVFSNCCDRMCSDSDHNLIIDCLYRDVVSALREAAIVSREKRIKGKRPKRVVGWNKHVSEAHSYARLRFNEWLNCGKPTSGVIYEEMCDTRKIFKSKLRWCQNHQEQIQMDILAELHTKKDFRNFWKSTKKHNLRPGLPVSVDGVSAEKDIANVFKSQFCVESSNIPPSGVVDSESQSVLEPSVKFSAVEIAKTIGCMTRGKSPGHDGLSIEHLQHAGPHLPRVLAMLFTFCIRHSYLPDELMRTVVVPIVKNKTGDVADGTNYRPISLATVIAKVFDSMLNTQLNSKITLHDNQFGFRPKLSTDSAILSLKHAVRYYTDRSTPVYACFLDLSRAFDLVSYKVLWRKLIDRKVAPEVVKIFQHWYGNQVNNVKWSGALSDSYRLECGVRQGGLSSPTLFNLYIDGLVAELSSRHIGCHVDDVCFNNISYADDMVLLSASIGGLRQLIDICETYAQTHGLKYNVKKSKVMVFNAGAKCPAEVPPVRLCGVPLERVHTFKYLGHIVTSDLKDDADIERERRALSVRANMIARRFSRSSKDVKITLFRAYCTSFYTSSLWVSYLQKSYSALRVQYNNALRALLRLPRFCSASGMFASVGIDCFYTSMRKRATSIASRVRDSGSSLLTVVANRLDGPFMQHWQALHAPVYRAWGR